MKKNQIFLLFTLLIAVSDANIMAALAQSVQQSTTFRLRGKSNGGTMTLMRAGGWNPFAQVTNRVGDSSALVLRQLTSQLRSHPEVYDGNVVRELMGDTVVLCCSIPWVLGGDDSGFETSLSPLAVSAQFDPKADTVDIKWINPADGYDTIQILYYGQSLALLPGNATQYLHHRSNLYDAGFSSTNFSIFVIGKKGDAAANGAGIRLTNSQKQESLMNIPFTLGVAPAFKTWSLNGSDNIKFRQGHLSEIVPNNIAHGLDNRGFYQVISGTGSFRGGVCRKFLGLPAGHKFRASARINTFLNEKGDWSLSFHASYNFSGGADLTNDQMAGVDPLPNGSKGNLAGLIAKFDGTHSTENQWVTLDSEKSERKASMDLTLPENVDSLTLWIRLEATNILNCNVGIDSVILEDLGKN